MSIQEINRIKNHYPAGTRIELISMDDPFAPVPSGMRGSVDYVDDAGQIHMKWDNGRTLAVLPGVDSFRKLTPEEIQAECHRFPNTSQTRIGRSGKRNV